MSSFYIAVNTTKRQFIRPEQFGDGPRFVEFAASNNGTMFALAALLMNENDTLNTDSSVVGSWAGDSVILAGDGDEPGKCVPAPDALAAATKIELADPQRGTVNPAHLTLYAVAQAVYDDVGARVLRVLDQDAFARFWMRQAVRRDGAPKARA